MASLRKSSQAPTTPARQRLLDATIDYLTRHGIGDLSLRQLASALGTSHRMLIYHFGSKEGLLVEVVQAMEQRQRWSLEQMRLAPGMSLADLTRRMWRQVSDPALWPHERLFYEVYGQALQGRPHAVPVLEGIVDSWVEPAAAALREQGVPDAAARAQARLGLAIVRGLLLDLLATGDREGVDAAMEAHISRYEALPDALDPPETGTCG